MLLSRDCGVQVLVPEANVCVPAVARTVRLAQPPSAPRRKRRGLRARHLEAAARSGIARSGSFGERREWLAGLLGHRLVMRGGELGRVDGRSFTAARGLTWRNVAWLEAGTAHETHASAVVNLCDVKDHEGKKQRDPLPVRAQARGGGGRGGARPRDRGGGGRATSRGAATRPLCLCAYTMLREAWDEDAAALGREAALEAPILEGVVGSRDQKKSGRPSQSSRVYLFGPDPSLGFCRTIFCDVNYFSL